MVFVNLLLEYSLLVYLNLYACVYFEFTVVILRKYANINVDIRNNWETLKLQRYYEN